MSSTPAIVLKRTLGISAITHRADDSVQLCCVPPSNFRFENLINKKWPRIILLDYIFKKP